MQPCRHGEMKPARHAAITTGAGAGSGAGSAAGGGAGSTAGGGGGAPGNFVDRQQPGQVLASKQLVGATVVGRKKGGMGEWNEVLLAAKGKGFGVWVGGGGFPGL